MLNIYKSNFLIFSGYHASGIAAVRDLLKGSNEVNVFPNEFRLVRERYGIYELYNSLFSPYCPQISDLALKDFIWLTEKMSKNSNILSGQGLGFDLLTNKSFSKATNNFIKEIVKYDYPIDFHLFDFKKSPLSFFIKRLKKKFTKNYSELDNAYMTLSDPKEFVYAVRKYLFSIFENTFPQNRSFIGLHNAISIQNDLVVKKSLDFFSNAKLIIVDRDPRDIYFDFPYDRYLPNPNLKHISRVHAFIDFYKILRKNKKEISNLDNVLIIHFEDLCLRTEIEVNKIKNFLNLKEDIKIGQFFDPDKSKQNIGIWKKEYNKKKTDINIIEKILLS
tara:strand:- start:35 stop:1033 length:999 start_codon:yes stop_codon:yes gene_type:complete